MKNCLCCLLFVLVHFIRFAAHTCCAQETAGIGAALAREDGRVVIAKLFPDGAALASRELDVGDWIIGVAEADSAETDVSTSNIVTVVSLIRGKKGTVVRLSVVPNGKDVRHARTVSMKRGSIAALERLGDGNILGSGAPIPNVAMVSLDDSSRTLSMTDLRGRYVLMHVWTTWCPPCQKIMHDLQGTARRHKSLKNKIVFVGASADETHALARQWVAKRKWEATLNVWLDVAAVKQLHVNSFPVAFLIDDVGNVIANSREDNFEKKLSEVLAHLARQ